VRLIEKCHEKVVNNVFYCSTSNFLLIGFCGGLGLRKWYGVLQTRFSSPNKTVNTLKKVSGELLEKRIREELPGDHSLSSNCHTTKDY
jgi:hypothetical protein